MLNDAFRRYLEEAIGVENSLVAFSAFEMPASVAIRRNPFKAGICPEGKKVEWCEHARLLSERPQFTLDPHFHAGSYYVQDSSSMFVGHAFRHLLKDMKLPQDRPIRVLDLCAAPGGKTTDIAASLREAFGSNFLLVSNEVMKARVGILADNVALWGDPNIVVSSDDPLAFSALPGFFDIIVADVPCSGEGMFRKDEQAQQQWSENNVSLCAARQKRIVADVWPALRQGGIFIYSTCTFNKYENDDNISWIVKELVAEMLFDSDLLKLGDKLIKTKYGYSLVPGHVEGEGQYCSAVRKTSSVEFKDARAPKHGRLKESQFPKWIEDYMNIDVLIRQRAELIIGVPKNIAFDLAVLEQQVRTVTVGCAIGSLKGQTLVPDADLALSLAFNKEIFPSAQVDRQSALAFLHRDAISLQDCPKGFVTVTYEGVPLGFVKNLGNRCNNLHPQSRRIRMDIKR